MSASPACLPERVRAAAAQVAARSRHVTLAEGAIQAYAEALAEAGTPPAAEEPGFDEGGREARAAFVVCLDAINFGSGWWPTIRKRPGLSGYGTISTALAERFRDRGPWSAEELRRLDAGAVAAALGQDPAHPLMAEYAAVLRDVGSHVAAGDGGSFLALPDAAGGSAPALAGLLAEWDGFADESTHDGEPVPFYKRAQIAAADLHRAGVARLSGLERLTAFADNLVPHVLRVDGVISLDPALAAAIDAGELLEHGSPAEVELRACAVHAVELLAAASGRPPFELDGLLWRRGAGRRYKAVARPRSRTTAY